VPFEDSVLAETRLFLFHLTYRENVPDILKSRRLRSAAQLMRLAGDLSFLRQKRHAAVSVSIGNRVIWIRDQMPLHAGNASLLDGWTFEDLIESLNKRVYFWTGGINGASDYGKRHFERYRDERPVILRVATSELFSANRNRKPHYCKFNSGSPRCSYGLRSPRGPTTFLPSTEVDYRPSDVREVTFENEVVLPDELWIGETMTGPWKRR